MKPNPSLFNRNRGVILATTSMLALSALQASAETLRPPANPVSTGISAPDRAGNGGRFLEMRIITAAYHVLDALQALEQKGKLDSDIDVRKLGEKLKVVRVRFKKDLTLDSEPKTMVNYPKENLLEVDEDDFSRNQDKYEELFQLTLHELLPLVGVVDNGYVRSIPLMKQFKTLDLLRKKAEKSNWNPVLLFSEVADDPSTGLDFASASSLCGIQKELHKTDYFFVYCTYLETTSNQVVLEAFEDWEFDLVRDHYGKNEIIRAKSHWRSHPVTRADSVYGLRVFGLGPSSQLSWKVVASSLGLAGGTLDRTFESKREADRACRVRLNESSADSVLFYQARCRTPQHDDGRYYYEIVTQNPLLHETQN